MNSTQQFANLDFNNLSTTPGSMVGTTARDTVNCILLVVSTILLLSLNPLCLLALRRVDNVQETTKIFLRSITTADLGIGIFLALPATVAALTQTDNFEVKVLCGVQAFVSKVCIYTTTLSLLFLTVDRLIAIELALRYPSLVTTKRARILVSCTWFVATLIELGHATATQWTPVYSESALSCICFSEESHEANHIIQTCLSISCLLVVLIAYTRLFLISCKHAKRIADDNQNAQAAIARPANRIRTKTLKTVLIIVISSFVFIILPMMFGSLRPYMTEATDHIASMLMFVLPTLTNSWFNTFIYYLRNREFRQVVHHLLASSNRRLRRRFPC